MLSLEDRKDYLAIGQDAAGKRDIEGLLPPDVVKSVYSSNLDLVQAQGSAISEEKRSAKSKLKRLLLDEFLRSVTPGSDALKSFYEVASTAQRCLTH